MIAFDLHCDNGHCFEGWFESNDAFETQKEKGLLSCPSCGSMSVSKALSPFGIVRSTASSRGAAIDPQAVLNDISRKIVDFIDNNFEDVGSNFTREALKIHYGASEPRNIKGVSSEAEEKLLREEGVDFVKIPVPSDQSDTDA